MIRARGAEGRGERGGDNQIRIRLTQGRDRKIHISFKQEKGGRDRILLLFILGLMVLGFGMITGLFIYFEYHRHKNPNLMPNESAWEHVRSLDAGQFADWLFQSRGGGNN